MNKKMEPLHEEILKILRSKNSSYARPMTSREIGARLNITPCYIRRQLGVLINYRLVGVRRGSGGGYYLTGGGQNMKRLDAMPNQSKYLNDLKDSLIDMGEYLPRLSKGFSQIAFTLQTGEGENAHKLLAQALEGIDWYLKLLSVSQSILGINYQEYEIYAGKTLADIINELNSVMNILYKAYQAGDLTLTADIIEYELLPVLETSSDVIGRLIINVENKLAS